MLVGFWLAAFLLCGTWLLSEMPCFWLVDATVVWLEITWVLDNWIDDLGVTAALLVWIALPGGRLFDSVVVGDWLDGVLLFGSWLGGVISPGV